MKIIGKVIKVGGKVVMALILVEFLSFGLVPFIGNGNAAFAVSAALVGGSFYLRRLYKQRHKTDKFGEGLRGSEVEDHSQNP